ncbi:sugar transferase [Spirochaeta dissipatitropha]
MDETRFNPKNVQLDPQARDDAARRLAAVRRRHFRLLSAFWLFFGMLLSAASVFVAAFIASYYWNIDTGLDSLLLLAGKLLAVSGIYVVSVLTLRKMRHLPRANLPGIFLVLLLVQYTLAIGFFISVQGLYIPLELLSGAVFSAVSIGVWIYFARRVVYLNLAVMPSSLSDELLARPSIGMALTKLEKGTSVESVRKFYDGVVFDSRDPVSSDWYDFLLHIRFAGIPLFELAEVYETVTGRLSLSHLSMGYAGELIPRFNVYRVFKRSIDILVVFITLPIVLSIMLLTWLLIRIESPGKAIFMQRRVGRHNREFKLYKFRSMYLDAEKHGPRFATAGDSRITRIGAIIRKYRIDELPQVLNILKGEMSWIGPRPEQPKFVRQFEKNIPYYPSRHLIRPGITGWAQVTQGYAADEKETSVKLSYDLYYLKHFGFWLDLLIVFKTLKAILTGFGAR